MGSLIDGYRNETEQLNAERIPQAVLLFLLFVGGAGACEYFFYPDDFPKWLVFYGLEVAVCVPLVALRGPLQRRHRLQPVNIAAWVMLSLLMHGFTAATHTPLELLAIGGVCLMAGASLLLPWGARGQAIVGGASVAAFALTLSLHEPASVPSAYLLFAMCTGAIISILGAHSLDLHRFAIFRETTLREAEVSISQHLVTVAKEITGSLDAPNAVDRTAEAIRAALDCDWCLVIVHEGGRKACVIAGCAGPVPAAFTELRGIEFGSGTFPFIDRVLAEHSVEINDPAEADASTMAFMRNERIHALLASSLTRSAEVVGLLIAGTRPETGAFSAHAARLFRGVAPHAASALTNIRLLADLRRADQLKSEFLSTMSHELRTPMNVVIGYTDLLLDEAFGTLQGEQRPVLSRLRDNAYSLLELINATLEVNRIEAGRARLELCDVSLRQLLTEVQRDVGHLPRQPGVVLQWDVSANDRTLRTDPAKFRIILRNVIGNALKFTEQGAVTVRVVEEPAAGWLNIHVHDTGPGIHPDDLPHIFGMFRQAHQNNHRGGVGLGLYIVKRFAEQLGGQISVTSSLGSGSTFRLSLPTGLGRADLQVGAAA